MTMHTSKQRRYLKKYLTFSWIFLLSVERHLQEKPDEKCPLTLSLAERYRFGRKKTKILREIQRNILG